MTPSVFRALPILLALAVVLAPAAPGVAHVVDGIEREAVDSVTTAQLEEWLRRLPQGGPRLPGPADDLSDVKIGAALREALEVATANAVAATGKVDGFFANQAIRILLPENLRAVEGALRAVGQAQLVDEFILGMNRAAERAAPAARRIFWDAIGEMTLGDVRRLFAGGDTAATDYFKEKTSERLTAAFEPFVADALGEVGVTRQYRELIGRAQRVPFLRLESLDIDRYVVGKTLDGLFHVVAEEERRIRTDPAARVTTLLREVFGRR